MLCADWRAAAAKSAALFAHDADECQGDAYPGNHRVGRGCVPGHRGAVEQFEVMRVGKRPVRTALAPATQR